MDHYEIRKTDTVTIEEGENHDGKRRVYFFFDDKNGHETFSFECPVRFAREFGNFLVDYFEQRVDTTE